MDTFEVTPQDIHQVLIRQRSIGGTYDIAQSQPPGVWEQKFTSSQHRSCTGREEGSHRKEASSINRTIFASTTSQGRSGTTYLTYAHDRSSQNHHLISR